MWNGELVLGKSGELKKRGESWLEPWGMKRCYLVLDMMPIFCHERCLMTLSTPNMRPRLRERRENQRPFQTLKTL
jgi:hypothetical protein